MAVQINHEMKLYVQTFSDGCTTLGFQVAQERSDKYYKWLLENGFNVTPNTYTPGTEAHYNCYSLMEYDVMQATIKLNKKCDVSLTPQLIGKEGQLVEVLDQNDEKRIFVVGVSSGPIPCHLELEKDDDDGGIASYGSPFKSVLVIG